MEQILMMTVETFQQSLSAGLPPDGASLALQALWWAGKDDWERAHGCAQQQEGDPACDQVHGYLHRREGDLDNAFYWYQRAGQAFPAISLDDEWRAITARLLAEAAHT